MEKDNFAYLKLILDSVRKIKEYISGMNFVKFTKDGKTQSAVTMQLQIIRELVKKIPEEIKLNIALPWKEMAGMRDMVSHDYFSLDLETIWNTATKDVPEVESKISEFLINIS